MRERHATGSVRKATSISLIRKHFLAAFFLVAIAAVLAQAAPVTVKQPATTKTEATALPYVRADFQPFTSPWKWRTAVEQNVNVYRSLFPNVDLFYAGNKNESEIALQLHPSADLSTVALDFPGATAISEDREGNLIVESPDGLAVLSLPYIYEAKKNLNGAFYDRGNNQVGIRIDSPYDRSKELFVRFNIGYSNDTSVVPVVSSAKNYQLISDSAFIIGAAAVATIAATKDDSLAIDANGNTKADPGDTLQYNVVVTNTGTDATGVQFDDLLDNNTTLVGGSVHASPIAFDDAYTTVGNTRLFVGTTVPAGEPSVTNATNPFANDTIATDAFSLLSFTAASANGGIVAMNADGTFTYTPPVGFSGTDTFTYTLQNATDATLTGTGTVTITVNNVVWYVDNSQAVNGNGRSNTPFNVLSATTVNGAGGVGDVDAANQIIYLFTGSGNYTGGLQLESGQQLIGNGVALVVSTFTLRAAGTNPTIVNAGGSGVTLNTGNTLSGFTVGNSSASAIAGTSFGNLTLSTVTINTNGQALNLSTGNASSVTFTSVTSSGGTNNVSLTSLTGTWDLAGGALSGATSHGFAVDGQNGTINYSGTIGNTTARSVSITNKTGGTVALSGAVSGSGQGIFLNSNTGATMNFTGGVVLNTGANAAFMATGGGTVNVTGSSNTLTTTTGTALNITSTTIGSSNVTFLSISANGASKGMILNTTGSSGSLNVTGTGTTDASGGTIQNISVRGAEFISTNGVSLKNMAFVNANNTDAGSVGVCDDLTTTGCNADMYLSSVTGITLDNVDISGTTVEEGINGNNVSNFTLTNSTITGCGNEIEEGCVKMRNLTGTCAISNSNISFPGADVVEIVNSSGSLLLNVNSSTFRDSQASGSGNTGIQLRNQGTSSGIINVNNSTFLRIRTVGLHVTAINSGSADVDVTGNTFDPDTGTMIGIDLDADNTGNLKFNVVNNTKIYSRNGPAINVFGDTNAVINGRINDNPDVQVKVNAGSNVGSGIRANINKDATARLEVKNNVVNVGSDDAGIDLTGIGKVTANPGGGTNTLDATVTGNNVTIGATSTYGLFTISASNAGDTNAICLNIASNTVTRNPSSIASLRARVPSASGFYRMNGFVTNPEATWNSNGNTPASSGGSEVSFGGSGTFGLCTAALPTNPTITPTAMLLPQAEQQEYMAANDSPSNENPDVLTSSGSSYPARVQFAALKSSRRNRSADVLAVANKTDVNPTGASVSGSQSLAQGPLGPIAPITIGTLPGGKSVTIKFRASINNPLTSPPNATQVCNQGTVSGSNFSNVLTNDPATVAANDPTCTALAQANLSITKSDSPDPIVPGANITYTLNFTNGGPDSAANVSVTDATPANTTLVSVTTPAGWTRTDSVPAGGTGTISFTRASVANAEAATFTIVVQVNVGTADGTVISNTANTASDTPDPNTANNAGTTTTTVTLPADLSLTKIVDDATPDKNQNITFTVTLTNSGPGATTAQVTDLLPAGLSFVSSTPSQGTYTSGTGVWAAGSIGVGSATLSITATTTTSGVKVNTAEVTASDHPDPDSTPNNHLPAEDDQASVTVTPNVSDLSLGKTVDVPNPVKNQNVTFTVTLTNGGPATATGVTVTDLLPAGLTFVSATPSTGSYNNGTGIWTVGTVGVGSATLAITATVATPGAKTNTAEVTTSNQFDNDSTPGNGVPAEDDQASVTVTPQSADLSLAKVVDNATPNVGSNVVFTLTLSNAGPNAATATVTDVLPAGLTFVSSTPSQGSYNSGTGIWTVGTVNSAGNATLQITATVATPGAKINTGEVTTSDQFDPDSTPGNGVPAEDDQASVTVTPLVADLSLTKTVDNATPNVGDNVTFTVSLSNAGPNASTGVVVTDLLPAGLSFVSATSSAGSYSSITGIWTVGTVAVGANMATLSITATVTAPGAKTNTAEVTASGTFDPDSTPNNHNPAEDDQASVTVAPQSADLSLTKTVDNAFPVVGNNVVFTITVANAGPNNATGVTVADQLPATLTFVSATPSQGSYSNVTGIWNVGTINNGANATLTITATVADNSVKINTAQVSGSGVFDPDSTPNNNNPAEDDQASVTITPENADLSLTKTDAPDPVVAGQNITYTLTYANAGPDDAVATTVTDATPAGTTFVSASVTTGTGWTVTSPAVGGTGNIVFSKDPSLSGDAATFQIVVKVNTNVANGTVITNTATADSDTNDANTANNTATATTTVSAQADLAVTKTDSPDPVFAGQNITYTLTLTNNGASDAQAVSLADTVPANTTFVSMTQTSGPTFTLITPPVGGTGAITATIASLSSGVTATFQVVVNVNASTANGTTITNTSLASTSTTDPTPGNNSATATTTVQTAADLAITKTDTPDPVLAGGNITYTIALANNGPSNASTVSMSDAIPANTTFVSAAQLTGPVFVLSTPPVGGTGTVMATNASFASGATATFQVVVNVNASTANGTIISNTAAAASATTDPAPGNESSTATTTVATQADLAVTKSDSPDPVSAGANITYTINFVNNGPSDAQTVTVTDAVPANTTFVSAVVTTGTGWTTTAPAVGATGNVIFDKTPVPAGETAVFTIVVKVNSDTATGTVITNTATAATDTTDPVSVNDSATTTTTVQTSADVSITKTDAPDPVFSGGNITYTIVVTNNGPSDALTLGLSDTTPANTTFVSLTAPAGWTSTTPPVGGTGAITSTNPSLAAGQTATFTLVLAVDNATVDGTVITNTATISTATTDPVGGNNSSNATTTVQRQADLSVTKDDSPDPVTPGQDITYTIHFANNGPNSAFNVEVTDDVPANTTFVSATAPAGWTSTTPAVGGTGTITFAKDPVNNAETADFTIVVNVGTAIPSGTTITNTVDVSSDTVDPDTSNNSFTTTTLVVRTGHSIAADPNGHFVVYAIDPNCGQEVLFYQAIDAMGAPAGSPVQLLGCGVLAGDVAGIDMAEDAGDFWISFGGSSATDGKYLMKISSAGAIVTAPQQVVPATKFGSTPGATSLLLLKGGKRIRIYLIANGGDVSRVNISKASLKAHKVRSLDITASSQVSMQITQDADANKRYLALQQPVNVFEAFGLGIKKGRPNGTSWRLCPTTEDGHELGSVAPDGFAALSNDAAGTGDKLYYQVLDADAMPSGTPNIVAGNTPTSDILSVDVTDALTGGNRFVVFTSDIGIYLQQVDSAGNTVGLPIPLL